MTEEALRVAGAQQNTANKTATANVQGLQSRVSELTQQRDRLADKLNKINQEYTAQTRALDNLSMALEGFQREKDNELVLAEKDYQEK